MQIATETQIAVFRIQARRIAQLPWPLRLWHRFAIRWQSAQQARVECAVHALGHEGLIADMQAACRQ
jgi:hypothetical protein